MHICSRRDVYMYYIKVMHFDIFYRFIEMITSLEMCLRSEEHTSELQSLAYLVCRLLLEKKKTYICNCNVSLKSNVFKCTNICSKVNKEQRNSVLPPISCDVGSCAATTHVSQSVVIGVV